MTMRALQGREEVVLAMQGYRGVQSYLSDHELHVQATRRPERVFKSACSAEQWAVVERHQHQLQRTQERQREGRTLSHPTTSRAPDLVSKASGQHSLHRYGATWVGQLAGEWPTVGRLRECNPQSAEP